MLLHPKSGLPYIKALDVSPAKTSGQNSLSQCRLTWGHLVRLLSNITFLCQICCPPRWDSFLFSIKWSVTTVASTFCSPSVQQATILFLHLVSKPATIWWHSLCFTCKMKRRRSFPPLSTMNSCFLPNIETFTQITRLVGWETHYVSLQNPCFKFTWTRNTPDTCASRLWK